MRGNGKLLALTVPSNTPLVYSVTVVLVPTKAKCVHTPAGTV